LQKVAAVIDELPLGLQEKYLFFIRYQSFVFIFKKKKKKPLVPTIAIACISLFGSINGKSLFIGFYFDSFPIMQMIHPFASVF